MKNITITTTSAKETQKIARLFAEEILRSSLEHSGALVIALDGDLGGGKTTFTQGIARGLGISTRILSPTFVILKSYNLKAKKYKLFFHVDAYRIEKIKELQILGWKDILIDKESIVLVEWADRIKRALPKDRIAIKFDFINKNSRKISINVK